MVLWPVLHTVNMDTSLLEQFHVLWSAYQAANEAYINAVASVYEEGDTVLVHDFQLMLLPALLRRRFPGIKVGFFFQVGVLLVGLLCPSLVDVTSCVARCAVPVSCSGGVSLLACAVGAGRRCLGCGFVGVPLANVPVSLYEDGKGVAGREVWTALDRVQQPPRVNHRSNGGHRYVRLRCSCARDVQQAAGGCAPCRLQALRAHPSSDGSNGIAAQEVRWLGRCGGP